MQPDESETPSTGAPMTAQQLEAMLGDQLRMAHEFLALTLDRYKHSADDASAASHAAMVVKAQASCHKIAGHLIKLNGNPPAERRKTPFLPVKLKDIVTYKEWKHIHTPPHLRSEAEKREAEMQGDMVHHEAYEKAMHEIANEVVQHGHKVREKWEYQMQKHAGEAEAPPVNEPERVDG